MYRRKIIAVDFDGTLCSNNWPGIGEPNLKLIKYLINHRKRGNRVILWTCRCDERLEAAVEWCKKHKLIFDAVNENLPGPVAFFGGDSRKIYADIYIDDKMSKKFKLPFKTK